MRRPQRNLIINIVLSSTIISSTSLSLVVAQSTTTSILTGAATTSTTSAGASQTSSSTTLKLAKNYVGQDFMDDFDYFTADDPTSGYVNYVSKSTASSNGLIDVQSDNTFIMRADYTNVASGRGRDSVRISSKDEFADGVYILDLNHMPVGCGTWPAWWTVVNSGWPKGGEIDIIEGVNGLPSQYSTAWNASSLTSTATTPNGLSYNAASLHTSDTCDLTSGAYMTGTLGSTECSAYVNGNTGCGVEMTGYQNGSYGQGFNSVRGGWYALWRDWENSGGSYVYYWPRDSDSVPDDVKNADTATTNVANWGEPAANLSVPTCKSDFGKHVIVFDVTFCGDYGTSTFTSVGCPSSCNSFVMNNPAAFTDAYWSLNSLRVYTASGQSAGTVSEGMALSKGAIAGIVVGVVVAVILAIILWYRIRTTRRNRRAAIAAMKEDGQLPPDAPDNYFNLAGLGAKPRIGPTKLAPGMTARHYLQGETPIGAGTASPTNSTKDLTLDPTMSTSTPTNTNTNPNSGFKAFLPTTTYVPKSTVQPSPSRNNRFASVSAQGTASNSRNSPSVPDFAEVRRAKANERPMGGSSWVG